MLMQLLQVPFVGDRGQALEEWERLVRQYEAQSSDNASGHDQSSNTSTQPTRSRKAEARWSERDEAARVRCSRRVESDASSIQTMEHSGRERHHSNGNRTKGKDKGKDKGKAKCKDNVKEGTSDTSNGKCSFCQAKRPHPKGLPHVLGRAR